MNLKHIKQLFGVIVISTVLDANAQSQLSVTCYQENLPLENYIDNRFEIDGVLIEYASCLPEPNFCLGVIDPNCEVWNTEFGDPTDGHYLGNYNQNSACRPREENYFVYRQSSAAELNALNNLLNGGIPNDHTIILYTTVGFDRNSVTQLCPQLLQTIEDKVGVSFSTVEDVFLLFGTMGYANSFDFFTVTSGDYLNEEFQICPTIVQEAEASIEEVGMNNYVLAPNPVDDKLVLSSKKGSSYQVVVTDNLGKEYYKVESISGEVIIPVDFLSSGVYTVVVSDLETRESLRFVKQ